MRCVHLTRSRNSGARRRVLKKLEIYEPPICCPTGVCGPAPDPALAKLQEDILRWKKEGIDVERLAINQAPQRFMANPAVVDLLIREGQEVLPVALLDGKVVCKGKYPTYDQVTGEGTRMPTYAYICRACGRPLEIQMSIREKEAWKPRCPVCGSAKVEQQLFGSSVGGGGKTPAPGGCPPGRGGCCG